METDLIDLFRSLASISAEETLLLQHGRRGEIAADARRRRGSGSAAYGASGAMTGSGVAVPISVNASF